MLYASYVSVGVVYLFGVITSVVFDEIALLIGWYHGTKLPEKLL